MSCIASVVTAAEGSQPPRAVGLTHTPLGSAMRSPPCHVHTSAYRCRVLLGDRSLVPQVTRHSRNGVGASGGRFGGVRAARRAQRGSSSSELLSFSETVELAALRGLHLSATELGPFYRIVIRDGSQEGAILGLTTGFVAAPFGLMHCDTLQIFNSRMGKGSETRNRAWGSARGLGLLLGGATFAYGREAGCRKAEILAINDDDAWAKRLVRYYSYFGFKPKYEVGGRGLADVPDMLVWGGAGTRMDADIESMLQRWSNSIRKESTARRAEHAEP